VEETRSLAARYDPSLPSFSGIGYAESLAFLAGRLSWDDAIAKDARRNVQLARRQATWFRREPDIDWLDATTAEPLGPALEATLAWLDMAVRA
jgi:tRNA dimethylallyltransferase